MGKQLKRYGHISSLLLLWAITIGADQQRPIKILKATDMTPANVEKAFRWYDEQIRDITSSTPRIVNTYINANNSGYVAPSLESLQAYADANFQRITGMRFRNNYDSLQALMKAGSDTVTPGYLFGKPNNIDSLNALMSRDVPSNTNIILPVSHKIDFYKDGPDANQVWYAFPVMNIDGDSNIVIDGGEIDGNAANNEFYNEFDSGINIHDSKNVWIRRMYLHNIAGDAIEVSGNCENINIEQCIIDMRVIYPAGLYYRLDNFEGSTTGYTGVDATISSVTTRALSGSYSLQVIQTDPAGFVYTDMPITNGRNYHVRTHVWKNNSTSNGVLMVGTTPGDDDILSMEFTDSLTWEMKTTEYFTIAGGGTAYISFRPGASGDTAWVDLQHNFEQSMVGRNGIAVDPTGSEVVKKLRIRDCILIGGYYNIDLEQYGTGSTIEDVLIDGCYLSDDGIDPYDTGGISQGWGSNDYRYNVTVSNTKFYGNSFAIWHKGLNQTAGDGFTYENLEFSHCEYAAFIANAYRPVDFDNIRVHSCGQAATGAFYVNEGVRFLNVRNSKFYENVDHGLYFWGVSGGDDSDNFSVTNCEAWSNGGGGFVFFNCDTFQVVANKSWSNGTYGMYFSDTNKNGIIEHNKLWGNGTDNLYISPNCTGLSYGLNLADEAATLSLGGRDNGGADPGATGVEMTHNDILLKTYRDVIDVPIVGVRLRAHNISAYPGAPYNSALVSDFSIATLGGAGTAADNTTERMRIKSNGKIGFGTSAPENAADFSFNQNTANNPQTFLKIGMDAAGLDPGAGNTEVSRWGIIFPGYRDVLSDGTVGAKIEAINLTRWGSAPYNAVMYPDIVISTLNTVPSDGDDTTEKLRITAAGSLGVGTPSPRGIGDFNGNVYGLRFKSDVALLDTGIDSVNAWKFGGYLPAYFLTWGDTTAKIATKFDIADMVTKTGTDTLIGSYVITSQPLFSNLVRPFTVSGAGLVSNLNADFIDGLEASSFVQTTGIQSIGGAKTFTSQLTISTGTTTGTLFGIYNSATSTESKAQAAIEATDRFMDLTSYSSYNTEYSEFTGKNVVRSTLGNLALVSANNAIDFYAGGTTSSDKKMTIDSNGAGIGTAPASGYSLVSSGKIRANDVFNHNGTDGAGATITVITALQWSGATLQFKSRDITYSGGIMTSAGSESSWQNVP